MSGQIDAFGANRQRLTNMLAEMPGFRMLPDNVFDVPHTIIVKKGKTQALVTINRFIDEMRTSGRLKAAIEQSRVVGVEVAPAGYGYGQAAVR
jgi:ABC-type amino acid transport substrate-binding protein